MAAEPPALPAARPEISVVIAHLNQPELLGRCLAALAAQSFDMGRARDHRGGQRLAQPARGGDRPLPRRDAGARAGARPRPGAQPRRGAGAGRRSSPSPTPTACPTRAGSPPSTPASRADPGLEILGGEVEIFPETPGDITPAEAFQMLYAYRQELYITRQNFSVTANIVIRREVFAAVGPFAGLEVAEDVDWGRRATRRGPPHRLCPGGARPAPRPPQHGRAPRHLGPPRDAFLPPGRPGPGRAAPLGADHPADGALAARGDPGDPRARELTPRRALAGVPRPAPRSGSTAPSAWPPCWRAGGTARRAGTAERAPECSARGTSRTCSVNGCRIRTRVSTPHCSARAAPGLPVRQAD